MNQELFLQELSKALMPLSEEERNEILFDFEEHMTEGMKEGGWKRTSSGNSVLQNKLQRN
ncbi:MULTISPECIES: HAAS signaling domain-containing protein [Bacillus]|uniref:HAAS signaling domain-containing protein n=1 Tax=Bacillus TaxID=1386 RepID=UPI003F58C5BD